MDEANAGEGLKFPNGIRLYVKYILPLIILFVFVMGYISMFSEISRFQQFLQKRRKEQGCLRYRN